MVRIIYREALDIVVNDTGVAKITHVNHHRWVRGCRCEIHPRKTMLQAIASTSISTALAQLRRLHHIIVVPSSRLRTRRCINMVLGKRLHAG